MTARPCPFTARATWGDVVVAETDGARYLDAPGEPTALGFPAADVRLDLLPDHGGRHLLRSDAAGLVAFDPERVVVELVDPSPDGDPRGVTTKRVPVWGDAADLIDLLDVRPAGPGRFTTVTRPDHRRAVVEGSQILGQAVVAAGRHESGRRCVSAHMVFSRVADPAEPLVLMLEDLGAGRTFSTIGCQVHQGHTRCASGQLLLDATAPDVVRHGAAAPEVPGPYDCEPVDMSVTGRDIRVVDGAYSGDPDAPPGPPVLDAWVRWRAVPDDPSLHAGLMAQFTGHMSIAAALRPHPGVGQAQAHRSLSTGVNAIALAVHGDVHADRWLLYHHRSIFAGDGMTHAQCRVHDEQGALVASFSVDAMVRSLRAGAAVDERSTL